MICLYVKMNNKSQAAMEFLMTYGWAILAAIIAIGVLAYFDVFSSDKYVVINSTCLKEYAIKYCSSINSSYDGSEISSASPKFNCYSLDNYRIDGAKYKAYYFLPSEIENCKS